MLVKLDNTFSTAHVGVGFEKQKRFVGSRIHGDSAEKSMAGLLGLCSCRLSNHLSNLKGWEGLVEGGQRRINGLKYPNMKQ